MMKKIKPIKIIVAVVTALVFCIALVVPCFADEPATTPIYGTKRQTFTSVTDFSSFVLSLPITDIVTVTLYTPGSAPYVFRYDGASEGEIVFHSTVYVPYSDDGTNNTLSKKEFVVDMNDGNVYMLEDGLDGSYLYTAITDELLQFLDGSLEVCYYVELVGQGDVAPTRSGMFGQLYNILRDAIFGKDVSLDDSQDFVLTQISTWMTYIVILLPILVVGVVLFKIFCR